MKKLLFILFIIFISCQTQKQWKEKGLRKGWITFDSLKYKEDINSDSVFSDSTNAKLNKIVDSLNRVLIRELVDTLNKVVAEKDLQKELIDSLIKVKTSKIVNKHYNKEKVVTKIEKIGCFDSIIFKSKTNKFVVINKGNNKYTIKVHYVKHITHIHPDKKNWFETNWWIWLIVIGILLIVIYIVKK